MGIGEDKKNPAVSNRRVLGSELVTGPGYLHVHLHFTF